ncbi:hypothetical protein A6P39_022995 [Streptomyces sp. FXJ1.172]|uniref:hypothetical protein n=1 Tax=Streptomyces sp. FXJ1.172 TaxID=710705 RepID=UPI0007CFD891|nr:hypothetical protein [Streptomyces sp. FXJ1.172]WEO96658.1 hypothetical protein A6P39_022995 [Streptomyces sp. FXJ1.172]
MSGLPYEECKRWQEEGRTPPRDPGAVTPAYAVPPFHPYFAERARERRRPRRSVDGATVSGVLTVLCLAALIVTVVAATLPS